MSHLSRPFSRDATLASPPGSPARAYSQCASTASRGTLSSGKLTARRVHEAVSSSSSSSLSRSGALWPMAAQTTLPVSHSWRCYLETHAHTENKAFWLLYKEYICPPEMFFLGAVNMRRTLRGGAWHFPSTSQQLLSKGRSARRIAGGKWEGVCVSECARCSGRPLRQNRVCSLRTPARLCSARLCPDGLRSGPLITDQHTSSSPLKSRGIFIRPLLLLCRLFLLRWHVLLRCSRSSLCDFVVPHQ